MRKTIILFSVLVALFAFFSLSVAQEAAQVETKPEVKAEVKHDFVGADKCKICHKAQFDAWSATPHAKAWDVLSAEEQKKPECISCHMTGMTAGEAPAMLTGVQCEACHGAGADYKSPKIKAKKNWADNREAALAAAKEAGLNPTPTAADCTRCHKKEGNPNFKEFDFEKMKGNVHPVKAEG